jgi:UDP-N-acetylglucosamine acyltransferase
MKTYSKNERNSIHPTSIIEDDVIIGEGNYIGPFCVIKNGTVIGDNNRFESHCVVGTNAESHEYFIDGSDFGVVIGNNNIIREFTTINAGTAQHTFIGSSNIMLKGSYFSHDSIMENGITLSCNVLIGGHSYLMEGCNMALGSICHQYSVIGAYSIVGMGSVVTKKSSIFPGGKFIGSPTKYLSKNTIGLERGLISDIKLRKFTYLYNLLIK